MKDKWMIAITVLLCIVLLIATCVILYNETIWFKNFIEWWKWLYEGFKTFHWGQFQPIGVNNV